MARVLLLPAADDPAARPGGGEEYARLLRAARVDRFGEHRLVDHPDEADLILFAITPGERRDLLRHPYVARYRERCFVFDAYSGSLPVLAGRYGCLPRSARLPGRGRHHTVRCHARQAPGSAEAHVRRRLPRALRRLRRLQREPPRHGWGLRLPPSLRSPTRPNPRRALPLRGRAPRFRLHPAPRRRPLPLLIRRGEPDAPAPGGAPPHRAPPRLPPGHHAERGEPPQGQVPRRRRAPPLLRLVRGRHAGVEVRTLPP